MVGMPNQAGGLSRRCERWIYHRHNRPATPGSPPEGGYPADDVAAGGILPSRALAVYRQI